MTAIAQNSATTSLKRLFDAQAARLTGAGLATEAELSALFPLLERIEKVTEGEGRIPFVIVLQNPALALTERVAKVVLDGNSGVSYLTYSRVTNLDTVPQGHYLAIDVEDGRAMLNTKPSVCLAQFKKANRFGGTVSEGISTVTYEPEILRHHYIDLPGSRYDGGSIPYLDVYVRPRLNACWNADAHPRYGSLSCGRRLRLGG